MYSRKVEASFATLFPSITTSLDGDAIVFFRPLICFHWENDVGSLT